MKKIIVALLAISACSPIVNSTDSPIQDGAGKQRGKMHITFTTNFGNNGKVTAVTDDGEIFNGEAVGIKSQNDDFYDSKSRYYSKAYAVLVGNQGHSMKCDFNVSEPRLGITSGAVGECKISDGRVVPVTLSGLTKKMG